jgi:hypothetical protein
MILLQPVSVQAKGLDALAFLAQNSKGLRPLGFGKQWLGVSVGVFSVCPAD